MVVSKTFVTCQSRCNGLVTAIHRDQIDVDVNQEIAFSGSLVDLDVFAMVGFPEIQEIRRVFGVVLHQETLRSKSIVNPVSQCMAKFSLGHSPVEGKGGD